MYYNLNLSLYLGNKWKGTNSAELLIIGNSEYLVGTDPVPRTLFNF